MASSAPTPQHAGVNGKIEGADGEARGVAREDVHHGPGAEHAESRAGSTEEQAFGEESAAQSASACAKGGADGQLAFAAYAAGENEVGDVGNGDDEDEAGGC